MESGQLLIWINSDLCVSAVVAGTQHQRAAVRKICALLVSAVALTMLTIVLGLAQQTTCTPGS